MAKIIPPLTDVQPRNAKPGKHCRLANNGGCYLFIHSGGWKCRQEI